MEQICINYKDSFSEPSFSVRPLFTKDLKYPVPTNQLSTYEHFKTYDIIKELEESVEKMDLNQINEKLSLIIKFFEQVIKSDSKYLRESGALSIFWIILLNLEDIQMKYDALLCIDGAIATSDDNATFYIDELPEDEFFNKIFELWMIENDDVSIIISFKLVISSIIENISKWRFTWTKNLCMIGVIEMYIEFLDSYYSAPIELIKQSAALINRVLKFFKRSVINRDLTTQEQALIIIKMFSDYLLLSIQISELYPFLSRYLFSIFDSNEFYWFPYFYTNRIFQSVYEVVSQKDFEVYHAQLIKLLCNALALEFDEKEDKLIQYQKEISQMIDSSLLLEKLYQDAEYDTPENNDYYCDEIAAILGVIEAKISTEQQFIGVFDMHRLILLFQEKLNYITKDCFLTLITTILYYGNYELINEFLDVVGREDMIDLILDNYSQNPDIDILKEFINANHKIAAFYNDSLFSQDITSHYEFIYEYLEKTKQFEQWALNERLND